MSAKKISVIVMLAVALLCAAVAQAAGTRGFRSFKDIHARANDKILYLCYGDTGNLSTETGAAEFALKCSNTLRVWGDKKGAFVKAEFLMPLEPVTEEANTAIPCVYEFIHVLVRDESDNIYSQEALSKMIAEPMQETITKNLYLSEKKYTLGELKITSRYCMDSVGKNRGRMLTLTVLPNKKK